MPQGTLLLLVVLPCCSCSLRTFNLPELALTPPFDSFYSSSSFSIVPSLFAFSAGALFLLLLLLGIPFPSLPFPFISSLLFSSPFSQRVLLTLTNSCSCFLLRRTPFFLSASLLPFVSPSLFLSRARSLFQK
jgi:hypothetical protein